MKYDKQFKTYDDLADMLFEHGMTGDRGEVLEGLQDVGYYRLSGYWYIFKEPDGKFAEGTDFGRVWDLYVFDRQFRLVVLDAIERVEIYFRNQLMHRLAEDGGAFGYLDAGNFPRFDADAYKSFIGRCKTAYNRSREPFAIHFREKYGDEHDLPPYWMIVNLMEFGTMLSMYRGASVEIRNEIADRMGVSARVLESWLVALNTTRNICCHHGRLWNRALGTRPKIPNAKSDARWHEPFEVRKDNMCGILTILSYLLERIAPNTSWRERLFALLGTRTDEELARMGFYGNWGECPFWAPWLASTGIESTSSPVSGESDGAGCLGVLWRLLRHGRN